MAVHISCTVEPPIEDPPNKGHCKYLSIRDSVFSPKILNSYMNGSEYNLLIKDNLSIKDKCFDFVLVPKCPLFRGSTVVKLHNTALLLSSEGTKCLCVGYTESGSPKALKERSPQNGQRWVEPTRSPTDPSSQDSRKEGVKLENGNQSRNSC